MSQTPPPDTGTRQMTTQSPTQTPTQAQNDHLNAQAAVLLNEFHAKTHRLISTELSNDFHCTICSEPYLRGDRPEVPIRLLNCGHIFGMNCTLKWLSPVSRGGHNSCPNCRTPIFGEWDKMDFPAAREIAPARTRRRRDGRSVAPIEGAPVANPNINGAPTRVPPVTLSGGNPYGGFPPYPRTATLLPAGFPIAIRARRTAVTAGPVDATATTISRRERGSASEEARIRFEQAQIHLANWETLLGTDLAQSRGWVLGLRREYERLFFAQGAAHRPAPAEPARPAEDEDNGVAAMFAAAEVEHVRQRQQEDTNKRKRHMWMQFCEGVVRTIEQSADSTAFTNHDLALTIINMKDLDQFMAERATESPTWRRILQTFPRLHTEMVTRFNDFRPLPSVNIDNRMELERLLASTTFNMEIVHKARWYARMSERLARGAATSNHEAAVARLTERMANLSSPSRESTVSTTSVGEQRTPEEARDTRRIEDFLLGRTPITVRREAAASVEAALRAGAESNFVMTRVTRL